MIPTICRDRVRAASAVSVTLCLLWAMSAAAQTETIYRSVSPNGELTYSSQPVPGARESKPIDIETMSPEQRRASLLLRRQDKKLSAAVNAQLQAREREWHRVDREIVFAQKALADAETALQKGRTPLAGERRGDAGGGSRLTAVYFQRLQQLETQVAQAKERLDQAYRARNALK